jgi:hypothetical protein
MKGGEPGSLVGTETNVEDDVPCSSPGLATAHGYPLIDGVRSLRR